MSQLRGRRATERRNRASIGDLWERHIWSAPDALAIIAGEGAYEQADFARVTYGQADAAANQFAHALHGAGLEDRDVAVLVCGNSTEALVAKIGMAKAGVVVAPLNPVLAPDVIAEVLERIGAKAAIVDAEHLPRVAPVLKQLDIPVLAAIRVGGAGPDTTGEWAELGSLPTFAELIAAQPTQEPDTVISGDDIWQLLFTSGTSAAPKAAMLSHHNTYYAALAWSPTLTLGVSHERAVVFGSYLPIVFHTGDVLAYAAWLVGGTVVVGRSPDPAATARGISEHGITALWAGLPQAVAGVIAAFDANPEYSAASLASLTYGWAPLEESLYDGLQRVVCHPVKVQSIIGMTEVVVAHRFWLDEHEHLYRSTTPRDNYVGLPNPVLAARLLDPETGEVQPRTEGLLGEAVYRSPALTAGYYRDPESTQDAMAGGWFHTGDLFGYGVDGQRMMVDRLKDVVKSGGENVSSIRVEAVLEGHPDVLRAAVVGVPHPRWGEAVTAAIIPRAGHTPDAAELITHCKSRLAGYEVPKAIVLVEDLPTSVGGKLQKQAIRALLSARHLYEKEQG